MSETQPPPPESEDLLQRAYVPAAIVVVTFSLALVWLAFHGETGSSVIGIGAVLAPPVFIALLAGLARPQKAARHALGLTGVALLLVAPMFGEGWFCILMMAPIYLTVTPALAVIVAVLSGHMPPGPRKVVLILPWLAFLADRPVPVEELPVRVISDEVVLDAPREHVWNEIDQLHLDFGPAPDVFVRLGLPVPLALYGDGAQVGAERRLVFHNGTLVARVVSSEPPYRFALELDEENPGREFFDHWAILERTVFELHELPDGKTRLVHATEYRRRVRPSFWFETMEQYGAHVIQGHLLATFAEQLQPAPSAAPAVAHK